MKARLLFLLASLIGVIGFLYLDQTSALKKCHYGIIDGYCNAAPYILDSILLITFPLLLLAVITYFADKRIASSWQRFTYWYLGIFVFIVLTLPEGGGGGWISGGSPTKATYAILLAALYFIISIVLLIKKAIHIRKTK